MDIVAIKDPNSDLPHKIPTPEIFLSHLAHLDIKPTDEIVFYDDFSVTGAARAHYLFKHFGIDSKIANFTLKYWLKQGYELEEGPVKFKEQVKSKEVDRR